MAKSKAAELLALLDGSTADDLAEIDAEIAAVEGKLDGLRSARKLIASKLGIVVEKKPRQVRTPAPGASEAPKPRGDNAARILALIATNGPERITKIAETLGVSYPTVHSIVSANVWFDKQNDGVHLTPAGVQAFKVGK